VREFLTLKEAERRSSVLTSVERSSVRTYYDIALRRLRAAQDLRLQGEMRAALLLFRQGGYYLALAFLVSKEPTTEVVSMDAETAFDRLASVLEEAGDPPPSHFSEARPFLASADRLDVDRLAADEARRLAEELEIFSASLCDRLKPQSPSAVRIKRILRLSILGALVLAAVVALGMWSFSSPNVALHKHATSSSQAYETTPEGAVDGRRYGALGFHSGNDTSPWLAIDLGARFKISRVKVYGRGDCCFDQSIPLGLEVSDDGVNYRIVSERSDAFSQFEPWVVKPDSLVARFVRLRTLRNSFLVTSEVEVYGRPAR
jgi:hypothetical protein